VVPGRDATAAARRCGDRARVTTPLRPRAGSGDGQVADGTASLRAHAFTRAHSTSSPAVDGDNSAGRLRRGRPARRPSVRDVPRRAPRARPVRSAAPRPNRVLDPRAFADLGTRTGRLACAVVRGFGFMTQHPMSTRRTDVVRLAGASLWPGVRRLRIHSTPRCQFTASFAGLTSAEPRDVRMPRQVLVGGPHHVPTERANVAGRKPCDAKSFVASQERCFASRAGRRDDYGHLVIVERRGRSPALPGGRVAGYPMNVRETAPQFSFIRDRRVVGG
jgi:hypothetical protein